MKFFIRYKYLVGCIAIILLIFSTYVFRKEVSIISWRITHIPSLSYALNPSAELAFSIGNYYFNTGVYADGTYDLKRAEQHFRKALRYDDSLPGPLYQLARIEFIIGDLNIALVRIDTHIKRHYSNQAYLVRGFYMRALILGFMGEADEAIDQYKELIELKKEIGEKGWASYNDFAWAYFLKGDFKNVAVVALEGLSYFPDNLWLLNMAGIAELNVGNKKEAKEFLEKSLELARQLTNADWSEAYPGNDPEITSTAVFTSLAC